ncbi:hypothetical protein ACLB1E_17895 [Escherichia coli]
MKNGGKAEKKYTKKIPAPQSAVDALLRFDFPALNAEFVQYHKNAYKSWNPSPSVTCLVNRPFLFLTR